MTSQIRGASIELFRATSTHKRITKRDFMLLQSVKLFLVTKNLMRVEIATSYTKNSPLDRRMGRTSLQIVEVNGMQLRYPKPSHVSWTR